MRRPYLLPMARSLPDASTWASEVATQLRLLEASASTRPPQERREFVAEVIGNSLEPVPAPLRTGYLDALADRFPDWNGAPATAAAEPPPPLPPETATDLLEKLGRRLGEVPDASKAPFIALLESAGWVRPVGSSGPAAEPVPSSAGQELMEALKLSKLPDLQRAMRLVPILLDMIGKLDRAACMTLTGLPTRAEFGAVNAEASAQELKSAVEEFLLADRQADPKELEVGLKKKLHGHRKRISALVACHEGSKKPVIPSSGLQFGRTWVEVWKPESFVEMVQTEKRGMFGFGSSVEERCWRKYCERCEEDLSPERIEQKVKEAASISAAYLYRFSSNP